jgi:hypothetical protein
MNILSSWILNEVTKILLGIVGKVFFSNELN